VSRPLPPEWLTARPVVHRALLDYELPESSVEAIERCVHSGYAVEIDVTKTADDRAVVFHDPSLGRLTGHKGNIADHTLAELQKLTFRDTSFGIPSLSDVLAAIAGKAGLLIEIKNRGRPGPLEKDVAACLENYEGPVAIQSFSPWTLCWFRRHCPKIPRGQLACDFDTDPIPEWKKWVLSNYGMTWWTRPHFLGHHWIHLPSMATTIARRLFHMPVLAWTIKTREQAKKALKHADNLICEAKGCPLNHTD